MYGLIQLFWPRFWTWSNSFWVLYEFRASQKCFHSINFGRAQFWPEKVLFFGPKKWTSGDNDVNNQPELDNLIQQRDLLSTQLQNLGNIQPSTINIVTELDVCSGNLSRVVSRINELKD